MTTAVDVTHPQVGDAYASLIPALVTELQAIGSLFDTGYYTFSVAPPAGMKRFNASNNELEAYSGAAWARQPLNYLSLSAGGTVAGTVNFSGTLTYGGTAVATTATVSSAVAGLAPTASPAFTGTPTISGTPTAGSTTVATQGWANGLFAPLVSPALTGTPTAPTPGAVANDTQLATRGYVYTYYAPLASPTFTGTVTAPTFHATTSFQFPDGTTMTTAATTPARGIAIYTSTNPSTQTTYTHTIPTGVTSEKISVIAGGGAGEADGSANSPGGAGGQGVKYLTGLTPGHTLNISVGPAGTNVYTSGPSSVTSGTQAITTISASRGTNGSGGIAGTNGSITGADYASSMYAPVNGGLGGYGGLSHYFAYLGYDNIGIGGNDSSGGATSGGPGLVVIEW